METWLGLPLTSPTSDLPPPNHPSACPSPEPRLPGTAPPQGLCAAGSSAWKVAPQMSTGRPASLSGEPRLGSLPPSSRVEVTTSRPRGRPSHALSPSVPLPASAALHVAHDLFLHLAVRFPFRT